jgi:hypothetical protein
MPVLLAFLGGLGILCGTLGPTVRHGYHGRANHLSAHAITALVHLRNGLVESLGVLLATYGLMR